MPSISNLLQNSGLKTRPNASHGLWLMYLLPISIIIGSLRHPQVLSIQYKLSTILCVGVLGTSLVFTVDSYFKHKFTKLHRLLLIPAILATTCFYYLNQTGNIFNIASGLLSCFGYIEIYKLLLKILPLSFSLGEAAIIAQSILLLIFSTITNVTMAFYKTPQKQSAISTLTIQIGLLGIGSICLFMYLFKRLKKTIYFYITTIFAITLFILVPLNFLLKMNPLIWIGTFLLDDILTMKMFIYWIICSIIAVVTIKTQIEEGQKASTSVRKIFHILALAVYLPGLLWQCSLLYLASGVTLGIFLFLEVLRVLNIPPLGEYLRNGYLVYKDEKDSGVVALTPIYLLAGCSLPLWIHPAPCDILDCAGYNLLPLLSGILSVGIGDSAASIVGSAFGKRKWPGSSKTIEGTIANVMSQVLFIFALYYTGNIGVDKQQAIKSLFAVTIGSFLEAFIDQIDNLVLPLVLYLILV